MRFVGAAIAVMVPVGVLAGVALWLYREAASLDAYEGWWTAREHARQNGTPLPLPRGGSRSERAHLFV